MEEGSNKVKRIIIKRTATPFKTMRLHLLLFLNINFREPADIFD